MITEISEIKKWIAIYKNPRTEAEFSSAMKALGKVHKKYGTIDINIIKQLIN